MPRYDFVLLDADNTLFDFDAAEHTALTAVLDARGYALTPEVNALYQSINHPLWESYSRGEVTQEFLTVERFRRLFAALGGGHDPAECNREYLARLAGCSLLYPDALPLVQALAPHCTLAIVTNGITAVQEGRFRDCPITPYLAGIFISESMGFSKPDPRFFVPVFAALGIADLRRAVVVGDTPGSDLLGAHHAGLDSIWYNPKGKTTDIPYTHQVSRLSDLSALILHNPPEGGTPSCVN